MASSGESSCDGQRQDTEALQVAVQGYLSGVGRDDSNADGYPAWGWATPPEEYGRYSNAKPSLPLIAKASSTTGTGAQTSADIITIARTLRTHFLRRQDRSRFGSQAVSQKFRLNGAPSPDEGE